MGWFCYVIVTGILIKVQIRFESIYKFKGITFNLKHGILNLYLTWRVLEQFSITKTLLTKLLKWKPQKRKDEIIK